MFLETYSLVNVLHLLINSFTAILCWQHELRKVNSKGVAPMPVPDSAPDKTTSLANLIPKLPTRTPLYSLTPHYNCS